MSISTVRAALWAIVLASPALADGPPIGRCMNLGAAMEAPVEGEWGYVIARADIAAVAAAGFDTLRFPVRFSAHWDGAQIDPAIMARVDEVTGWARDEGLRVILDLHHFWPLMDDPATHAPTYVAIWDWLGARYAGAGDWLIFELMNEPEGAMTTPKAWALQSQVLTRLRPAHPDRWIVTGGADWNNLDELWNLPPAGHRELRTFHYYAPWDFTHQQVPYEDDPPPPGPWGTQAERAAMAADMARAATLGTPLLLGEFGVYDAAPAKDRLDWIRAVRESAEANGIPWCYWGFSQGNQPGFRAVDAQGNWQPGILEALTD
ncbi:MAG: glycoside hydrolase family 5 protein [Paracoccaceae bacterium]